MTSPAFPFGEQQRRSHIGNMKREEPIVAATHAGSRPLVLLPVTSAIVLAAYTMTLSVANALPLTEALAPAAANALPTILFGSVAYWIARNRLAGRGFAAQLLGHALAGAVYSLLAYWLLMVLLGLVNGTSATEFAVRPFASRAMSWQLLENLTTYGVIAVLATLHARPPPVVLILGEGNGADTGGRPSRYFIRSGDELRPIDVAEIVSITGADDYAEVATPSGRHLVRMTLTAFEESLDPARFLRVHRSYIVNIERIERAEPAGGGRMLLHMETGEAIPASRAGTRLLRDRLI